MIISREPMSMAEVAGRIENKEDTSHIFIKRFVEMDRESAEDMKKELQSLEIIQLKSQHIAKIIDFLPEDLADLNKVLVDVNLSEDESNKILGTVKKNR